MSNLKDRAERAAYSALLNAVGVQPKNDAELKELLEAVGPHWWDHIIESAKLSAPDREYFIAEGHDWRMEQLLAQLHDNPRMAEPREDGTNSLDEEAWWYGGWRAALNDLAKKLELDPPSEVKRLQLF